MKSTGMIRSVDKIGRFKIPELILKKLNIHQNDLLVIHKEDGHIVIDKYSNSCVFCGSKKAVLKFNSKSVCKTCLNSLKDI